MCVRTLLPMVLLVALLWRASGSAAIAETVGPPEIALNAQWAEKALRGEAPTTVPADRLVVIHEDVAGDTKAGRCGFGTPLRLADKTYTRGIGVNSTCVLRVFTTQPAVRFVADIGLDRNVDTTAASVTMHVSIGDKCLFQTDILRPDGAVQPIDVALGGTHEFDLIVNDGGDGRGWDQADWADARVILQDGTQLWLDDLARRATLSQDLPFSFVYDGKSSRDVLAQWSRKTSCEVLDAGRTRQTLTLTCPTTHLEVRVESTIYTDTPGVDWTLTFTNRGESDTPRLEQVLALDNAITAGLSMSPVLHRLRGSTCAADDWMPLDDVVPVGQRIEFGAVNGRSSADSPFFTLDWGSGGVVTAVGWSGPWRGSVAHEPDHALRVQAGMQHLSLKLHPGESIRSPRILQLYYQSPADQFHASNLFRRTMLKHVVPKCGDETAVPPIVHMSTSFYELNSTNEANVLSHLKAIEGLGFEMFWVDAYWTRDGFPAGMGHYGFPLERVEPRDRFPRGITPIRDAVHKAGLKYLMWFEPERVHPGTLLAQEHSEWVISPAGDGSGLFNLGLPEARQFMTRYLAEAIREYGIDCLRIDFNIDPLPFWEYLNQREPDRVGIGEIRYVEGLYQMWDDLRATYPGLLIDNCASGGRRIDLETCARSLPLWRSDNTCDMVGSDPARIAHAAIKNQLMSCGLNRYLPFSMVGQMGSSPYLFRSGFNGGIAFAEDCRPADYPRAQVQQAIAEAKRIRPYWFGEFFPLSTPSLDPTAWCVMQYDRPDERDGIVLGFRRENSPYTSYECELRNIEPDARYEVRVSQDYQPQPASILTGAELSRYRLTIDSKPGSVLLEYRLVGPAAK